MATVSGTFTAVGQSAVLDVPAVDEEITASLTGTWVATVRLEREIAPHSNTWEVIRSDTGNYSIVIQQIRKNERYRFNTVAFTSGTVTFSVADAVLELTQITDPNTGALLAHYDEDGFVVDGDFDVTGTFTGTGTGVFTTVNAVTGDFEVIEAGDASLDINGLDATQGGIVRLVGGTSSATSTAGGAVILTGGAPGDPGTGGAVELMAAAGGTSGGAGGAIIATGGAGTSGNSTGGRCDITGGAGSGSSAGGAAEVTAGDGGATGIGGAVTLAAGAAVAVTSGTGAAGGACTNTTGAGAAGTSGANGGASGDLTLASGAAGTTDTGIGAASGAVILETAAGGLLSGDATGAAGASGTLTIRTGVGGAHANGAGAGGAGGAIAITAGAGGEDTEDEDGSGGVGGNISLTAGAGGDGETSGRGGAVILTPGTIGTNDGGTAPIAGAVHLRKAANAEMPVFFQTAVFPAAKTTDAVLTVAEVFGQVLVIDDGGGATATMTLPTGTAMSAAAPADIASGDSFYFHVINEGTTATELAVIAAGSNFLLQGSGTIEEQDSAINPSSGTFIIRFVSGNDWTCSRVA